MEYYILENRQMPWGDYGNMLFSGLLKVMDKNYKIVDVHSIERTGPYIPEVYTTISEYLVVREDIKNLLLTNGITGIKMIHDTTITKLVNIDWQSWDLEAKEPKVYPSGGEPYNYIATRKNNSKLLSEVNEKYYSLSFEEDCELKIMSDKKRVLIGTPQFDLFIPTNMSYTIVSTKFKELIQLNTENCLRFIPVEYEQ